MADLVWYVSTCVNAHSAAHVLCGPRLQHLLVDRPLLVWFRGALHRVQASRSIQSDRQSVGEFPDPAHAHDSPQESQI